MFNQLNQGNNQDNTPKRNTTSKEKLQDLSNTTDMLVFGAATEDIKKRDRNMDDLISNTLKTTIKSQFGNTNKPLEYFSLNLLNNLWKQTDSSTKPKKKDFEEVLKQYVQETSTGIGMFDKIKYQNYRNIYTHLPAAHVALNIYKSSILSPESLTDEPINFSYKTNNEKTKKIIEQRIKHRVIDKYKLNKEMDSIVKEALIDGVSYRALISIEQDIEGILRDRKILTEDGTRKSLNEESLRKILDENYVNNEVKFYDSEISKEQTAFFNQAIQESINGYIDVANKYIKSKNSIEEDKEKARVLIESLTDLVKKEPVGKDKNREVIEYSGAQIGRFAKELINENIIVKSKYDLMKDYVDALNEGYIIDKPIINEDGTESFSKTREKGSMYLNGSKILTLEPERVTPIRIGNITIGYIYTERDSTQDPMTVNAGVGGGSANLAQTGPVSYGMNTFGSTGLNGLNNSQNSVYSNPLSLINNKYSSSDYIVNLFINGLGKKLNKSFIRNNKDLKELIHELLREKYITQRKVAITFLSSDDVVETRVKPLFEGSEFFAKLYLAELTNNITISLGRGMDRRMIKIPFGLDESMEEAVQTAIRTFKTREFSVGSIDESSISTLVRNSPGRYEDIYVPVAPDGTMGYDIDILPGMDNTKSSELLPQLRNQFLDSINIPASAIDSTAEMDFSRSVALRNVYFSKEIVDYQKVFNETITQIIRKIYTDEYKYNGNRENEETNISLDNFDASFSKPYTLDVSMTLEALQNVDQYANIIVGVQLDVTDPSNKYAAFALRRKIFKDTISYIPWDEYEEFVKNAKTEGVVAEIKRSGKKGDPSASEDPNNFNPGGFSY